MHEATIDLKHGDCLELMKDIPDGSVDLVLTDPPYLCNYSRHDSKSRFSNKIANDENNCAKQLRRNPVCMQKNNIRRKVSGGRLR